MDRCLGKQRGKKKVAVFLGHSGYKAARRVEISGVSRCVENPFPFFNFSIIVGRVKFRNQSLFMLNIFKSVCKFSMYSTQ